VMQNTIANHTKYPSAAVLANPSDNRLLTNFIDPALGCMPWMAPDLSNYSLPAPALALDELQAEAWQKDPAMLVSAGDPMTQMDGQLNATKVIAYRQGVDQSPSASSDVQAYCANLAQVGIPRLQMDQQLTSAAASPFPTQANSLYTFLALRFSQSWQILGCQGANPVTLITNNGIVTAASYQQPVPVDEDAPK
jgi:hypothetical protein